MLVFNGALYMCTSLNPLGENGAAICRFDDPGFTTVLDKPIPQGILRMREVDGKIFAINSDPAELIPGYVYISDATGTNWNSVTIPTGAHLFDVVKAGGKIYLSGQDGAPGSGAIWTSQDGGAFFDLQGNRGGAARHMFMILYSGQILMAVNRFEIMSLDPATGNGSPIAEAYRCLRFREINGVLYMGGYSDGHAHAYRKMGTGAATIPGGLDNMLVWDFCELGGRIYALAENGLYESTDNGLNFTQIIAAPAGNPFDRLKPEPTKWNPTAMGSLGVYNGSIYAGTVQNGHVYRVQ
jgi:hypothetical protein